MQLVSATGHALRWINKCGLWNVVMEKPKFLSEHSQLKEAATQAQGIVVLWLLFVVDGMVSSHK